MDNQPTPPPPAAATARSWFRLASLTRAEQTQAAPGATPVAQPTPSTAIAARPSPAPAPRFPLARPAAEQVQAQPQLPPVTTIVQAPSAPPQTQPSPPRPQAAPPSPRSPPQEPIPTTTVLQPAPPPPSPRSMVPTPESPRVSKPATPPLPESPTIRGLQPVKAPPPSYPEPGPKQLPTPSPKIHRSTQQGNGDSEVKTIADINHKPQANGNLSYMDARTPPPPPKKEPAARNGTTGTATAGKKEEDGEMKFITMAGENMGAYMELGFNRKQQQGQRLWHQHLIEGSTSQSEDGKAEHKEKGKKSATEGKPMATLVNSNVQSVNNSILLRSSSTQQSPGVHVTIVSRRQPKHKGIPH